MNTRQIVLDTETTGINKFGKKHYYGHNIIEIGAIEIINRRITNNFFHTYIKPDRLIEKEAFKIHGIKNEFLMDKPTFQEISKKLLRFIYKSELIIHNAQFDVGFIDYEFSKLSRKIPSITKFCKIIDTLQLARKLFPGKKNNLNALCDRYNIDYSNRILHSALLDAKILAKVYFAMTRGQISLQFSENLKNKEKYLNKIKKFKNKIVNLKVVYANSSEILSHQKILNSITKNKS